MNQIVSAKSLAAILFRRVLAEGDEEGDDSFGPRLIFTVSFTQASFSTRFVATMTESSRQPFGACSFFN